MVDLFSPGNVWFGEIDGGEFSLSSPEAISSRVMLSNDGSGSVLNKQQQVIHFSIRYWKDMVGGGLTYLPLFFVGVSIVLLMRRQH